MGLNGPPIYYEGDSGSIPVKENTPLPVSNAAGDASLSNLEDILDGTNHIGEVSGKSRILTITPTISTTPAYSTGDNVGGKLALTSAMRVSGGTGVLQSIHLLERANQKPELEILIFTSDPSNATITDNAAFVSSTDDLKVQARIPIFAGDWKTIGSGSKGYATKTGIGAIVEAVGSDTLYAAIVFTGATAFQYATAGDLQVKFGFLLD